MFYKHFEKQVRANRVIVQGRPEGIFVVGGSFTDRVLALGLSRADKLSLASVAKEAKSARIEDALSVWKQANRRSAEVQA